MKKLEALSKQELLTYFLQELENIKKVRKRSRLNRSNQRVCKIVEHFSATYKSDEDMLNLMVVGSCFFKGVVATMRNKYEIDKQLFTRVGYSGCTGCSANRYNNDRCCTNCIVREECSIITGNIPYKVINIVLLNSLELKMNKICQGRYRSDLNLVRDLIVNMVYSKLEFNSFKRKNGLNL